MSIQKKLQTLGNNESIISILPGELKGSLLRKEFFVKTKEVFQVSSDRALPITNANFSTQGDVKIREPFTKNCVVQIILPVAGNGTTYTLVQHWGLKLLQNGRLYERTGGSEEIVKHLWANNLQTIRECDDMETRDKYMNYTGTAGVISPTSSVEARTAYVFLNVQAGSINPALAQYYPNYQLNQSNQILMDFGASTDIVSAGTAPTSFQSCDLLIEYADTLHNKDKKSKFDVGKMIGGAEIFTHEIVSYEYPLAANGTLSRSQLLRSIPSSEIDELVMFFTTNTDINNRDLYSTQRLTNIKLTFSDREVIHSRNNYQEVKQLWRNELPCVFKNNNVEKNFYVLDLTPINYKMSEKKNFYIQGVIMSEEDILLEFDVPTDVAGKLFIYGVKKVGHLFKNGGMRRTY